MEFLTTYLKNGFGSMTKNDLEVWVFNELLKDPEKINYSDYDVSIQYEKCRRVQQGVSFIITES